MATIVYSTVVVGVVSTPILPDRSVGRERLYALVYNPGPVPLYARFREAAVVAGTPPVLSGGSAVIKPDVELDDWMQQAYNGIVTAGVVSLLVMEVLRS